MPDGSGTGVNDALVTYPDKAVVPPGLIEMEFTVKVNEPFPLALENVKVWLGFEKTMLTPPVAVVLTFPNKFATKVVDPPPVIPVGSENAICRSTTPLYVVGVVERVKDPKLLKPTNPPEVIPLKLPGTNEMPDGGVEEVVPVSVISSARALAEAKANTATSKTNAITHVRFKSALSLDRLNSCVCTTKAMVSLANGLPPLTKC